MTKKVAIVQSNYIPWKGYFDMIAAVDEFILYDDVQYTRRDWRNRNQIKTPQGLQWLSVPVRVKDRYRQKIRDTEIDGTKWAQTHWKSLLRNYARAAHFEEVTSWLEELYIGRSYSHLSELNRQFIVAICQFLGIGTQISCSQDYTLLPGKSERLADLCRQAGGGEYISGPAAREYLDTDVFAHQGIKISWFDYQGFPEYPQLWGEFVHEVSVLDLLFNCGQDAQRFMRHVHCRFQE